MLDSVGARGADGGFVDVGDVAGIDKVRDAELQAEIVREGLTTAHRIERRSASGARPGTDLRPHIVVTVCFEGIIKDATTGERKLRDPKRVHIRSDRGPGDADAMAGLEAVSLPAGPKMPKMPKMPKRSKASKSTTTARRSSKAPRPRDGWPHGPLTVWAEGARWCVIRAGARCRSRRHCGWRRRGARWCVIRAGARGIASEELDEQAHDLRIGVESRLLAVEGLEELGRRKLVAHVGGDRVCPGLGQVGPDAHNGAWQLLQPGHGPRGRPPSGAR